MPKKKRPIQPKRYTVALFSGPGDHIDDALDRRHASTSQECLEVAVDLLSLMDALQPGDRLVVIDNTPEA